MSTFLPWLKAQNVPEKNHGKPENPGFPQVLVEADAL
jgi:hypothetical protein